MSGRSAYSSASLASGSRNGTAVLVSCAKCSGAVARRCSASAKPSANRLSPPSRRGDERVQRLEARYRLAVGVVGVQAEAEIGVGEILRLRHRAHVEGQSVVGLEHAPDERHARARIACSVGRHPLTKASPSCSRRVSHSEPRARRRCAAASELDPGEVACGIERRRPRARCAPPAPVRCRRLPAACAASHAGAEGSPDAALALPLDAHAPNPRRRRSGCAAPPAGRRCRPGAGRCAGRGRAARLSRSHRLGNSLTAPSLHSMVSASGAATARGLRCGQS